MCLKSKTFFTFLAAGEAEQIQSSVLVFFFFFFFMFMFSFSNLYPYCQSRVSFGYLDFQGTSPQGALYPLGHFTLWGPLTLGAFCPQGPFALHDLLLFGSFFSQGPFALRGHQGSFTFWVIQIFGDFWVLFLLPAAGTEGSSVFF